MPPPPSASPAVVLDADLLRRCIGCTQELAERYAAPLADACALFGIDTPQRLAAFVAQIGHESGSLRYVRELWGPTAAQARYEGRSDLGNTQTGDGKRFMGRGLIQLTGRANARAARDALRKQLGFGVPDFEAEPERLEEPDWAAIAAAWFWASRGCNELADAGGFEAITRRINGGLNGQADRLARHARALAALAAPPPAAPRADAPDPAAVRAAADKETTDMGLLPFLGGALLDAFAPLAREKIEQALARHTGRPEVATQIAATLIDTAKSVTGHADELQAVAAAKADPEAMRHVEQAGLAKLDELAPWIDRLAEIDRQDRAADEASSAAAAARAQDEPWDMTRALVAGAGLVIGSLILLVAVVALAQLFLSPDHQIASEVWAQVVGLISFAAGVGSTIYAYRFGTSRSSAAKDAIVASLADARRKP